MSDATNQPDKIVGHKTVSDGRGGYTHQPLYASEAEAIQRECDEADAARSELMPTEASAIALFFNAWLRLKEFGWREAMYCPKGGVLFDAIEAGSTGIHKCSYEGEWATGSYFVHSEGDLWPSNPVLIRDRPIQDQT